MITLQSIFASGWIQIIILVAIFIGFTRWSLNQGGKTGYALGWLIGAFFIVIYGSLFPRTPLNVAIEAPTQLNFLTVISSSIVGAVIAILIIGITLALKQPLFRQIFATAAITSVLVTILFMMIMSSTQSKMALTLASLAFAIVIGVAYVVRRAYLHQNIEPIDVDSPPLSTPGVNGRIEQIREQATTNHRLR